MRLKKVKDTYNDYELTVSWGELQAFYGALQADHTDPVRDEKLAELDYYLQHVAGPGEDEEEIKAKQKAAQGGGKEGAVEGEDIPVALPPGSEAGTPPEDGSEQRGYPPEEGDEASGPEEPHGLKVLKGEAEPAPQHGLPEEGMDAVPETGGAESPDSADHRLPPPPRE